MFWGLDSKDTRRAKQSGRSSTCSQSPPSTGTKTQKRKEEKSTGRDVWKTGRLMAKTINSTQSQFEASSSPCRQTFGAVTNSFSENSIFWGWEGPHKSRILCGKEVSGRVAEGRPRPISSAVCVAKAANESTTLAPLPETPQRSPSISEASGISIWLCDLCHAAPGNELSFP